ncbi:hypothetical protein X743_11430 [Mesorhizobium sp. LNHC252B00]|nr:hypothetical protein X743_11430 [Mesorhizobium sp. LNHC252B00]
MFSSYEIDAELRASQPNFEQVQAFPDRASVPRDMGPKSDSKTQ